jgi:hypothetical protein
MDGMMDGAVISQLTSAAIVVYLLQYLKKTAWYPKFAAAVPMDAAHVHRLVSAAGALLSAVGVHIAFTGDVATGWHFAGTIPPLHEIVHSAWDWAQQFALNQLTYDAVLQRAGTKSIELSSLPTSPAPTMRLPVVLLAAVLGAGVLTSSCTSNKLVNAVNAEHVAVTTVHAVVQAEAQAFRAGAYDNARHQTYVAALLKVVQSEKALNDALMTWNAASGQPMPQVVSVAVVSLQQILRDVTPLVPSNTSVGALVASANAAIAAITGGK